MQPPTTMPRADNSSRRAFELDSRMTWVESMHDRFGNLTRMDNLPNGPGEYSPVAIKKHLPGPLIGHVSPFGKITTIDHFKPFKSNVTRPTFDAFTEDDSSIASIRFSNYNSHHQSSSSPKQKAKAKRGSDMKTIYHNARERLAHDPNLQFCDTPSPNLTHQSMLNTLRHDGRHTVRNVVMGPDDIPFGERCGNDIKIALPDYNVNYDSKYLRPHVKLAKISKTLRFKSTDEDKDRVAENESKRPETIGNRSITGKGTSIRDNNDVEHGGGNDDDDFIEFKFEAPKGGIKMPNLKFRKKLQLEFDSSCYDRNPRQKETLNLTPQKINKQIRKNHFLSVLFVPHMYKSRNVEGVINHKMRLAFEADTRAAIAKKKKSKMEELVLRPKSRETYYVRTNFPTNLKPNPHGTGTQRSIQFSQ